MPWRRSRRHAAVVRKTLSCATRTEEDLPWEIADTIDCVRQAGPRERDRLAFIRTMMESAPSRMRWPPSRAGCSQVQGTVNGYGERCGNANLVAVIGDLSLKLKM